jgi:hypothetical protein
MMELRKVFLEDRNLPRKAFYQLFLYEKEEGGYLIENHSGAAGKVHDQRSWEKPTMEEADRMFASILGRKTTPARRSPRHYSFVCNIFKFPD